MFVASSARPAVGSNRCGQFGSQLSLNIPYTVVAHLPTRERWLCRLLCPEKQRTRGNCTDNNSSTGHRRGTRRFLLPIGDFLNGAGRAGFPVLFGCHDDTLFDEGEWPDSTSFSMTARAVSVTRLTVLLFRETMTGTLLSLVSQALQESVPLTIVMSHTKAGTTGPKSIETARFSTFLRVICLFSIVSLPSD